MEKMILRHWRTLTIGCILTGVFIKVEYYTRGNFAIGGEWLIIPFCLIVGDVLKHIDRRHRNV